MKTTIQYFFINLKKCHNFQITTTVNPHCMMHDVGKLRTETGTNSTSTGHTSETTIITRGHLHWQHQQQTDTKVCTQNQIAAVGNTNQGILKFSKAVCLKTCNKILLSKDSINSIQSMQKTKKH